MAHLLINHLIQLRDDPLYRKEKGLVLIEGKKLIYELRPYIKKLYTLIPPSIDFENIEWMHLSEKEMKKVSAVKSPEGWIAEAFLPSFGPIEKASSILVLDEINDPGNLGTILRTALAFGWEGVLLLPGSVDPYQEKVLRSAKGAQFRLNIQKGTIEDLKNFKQNGYQLFGASLEGSAPPRTKEKTILILGNEARGLSDPVKNLCELITLPMSGSMESLNVAVAGGILLYLMKGEK